MSMRTFITCSSLLLLGWLALAFMHRAQVQEGPESLAVQSRISSPQLATEVEQMAVSVSP